MKRFLKLSELDSPSAVIDIEKMNSNIRRMQARMDSLGVKFRPHVKTSKCMPVVQAQIDAGASGVTVSTLKEARYFFEKGVSDILYAVGISAHKLSQIYEMRKAGCALKIITDSAESAAAIADFAKEHNTSFDVMIEIDTDGHRSGIQPEQDELISTAKVLHDSGVGVYGVLTHAGSSYELSTPEALQAMAEQERAGCVRAAERVRAAGISCDVVSVGSTPTALSAKSLEGVTEVRAGVYVFFDLVMHNIGVCRIEDIAMGVLARVIGHQKEKGWAIIDSGWMAMSRDQGTKAQQRNFGYGQVCDISGKPLPYIVSGANQEHGIISATESVDTNIAESFPLGKLLWILPNHACATGAQFPEYHAIDSEGNIELWPRIYGW